MMKIDIKGKVIEKKLSYNNTLLPLFEAIVNSIQAIEEKKMSHPGLIEVQIQRINQPELDMNAPEKLPDITDFIIKDNGIGFNSANYDSFNYAHSTYKKGGKGIGRFTWLRAFGKAEIESVFFEDDNWNIRKFSFEPTKNGINNHEVKKIEDLKNVYTTVKLKGLKEDYRKWCNTKTEDIAFKIIEHVFIFLVDENCPRIVIHDMGQQLVVNDFVNLYTKSNVIRKPIVLDSNKFDLTILKLYSDRIDNKIHYCANKREVIYDKLSIEIPEFDSHLKDSEGKKFSIAVYVEGDYLDENVNDERTAIHFKKGEINFDRMTSQEELRKEITECVSNEFINELEVVANIRFSKVKDFVSEHPRYKQLLKYKPDKIKRIPSNLPDDKLEIEVFKVQQELDLEVLEESRRAMRFIDSEEDYEEFMKNHKELYSKIIEVGNSKLSEYVIHRKLVLDLFEKMLKRKATEKAVHNLIFPLRTLSDEIGFEDHNLWMLDEKLAYHKYLASDKSFKQNNELDSESKDRPDIIVFNKTFAFANDAKPYNSIVLIEFKRPMRNDYTDTENPITQVNKYAREILSGDVRDKDDRDFNLSSNTPIYAYIVCDITKKLEAFAKDSGFKPTPARDGYFFFNDNYNMYIEILSFDKVLNNAKERNRVLFEKLNM